MKHEIKLTLTTAARENYARVNWYECVICGGNFPAGEMIGENCQSCNDDPHYFDIDLYHFDKGTVWDHKYQSINQ